MHLYRAETSVRNQANNIPVARSPYKLVGRMFTRTTISRIRDFINWGDSPH